MTEEKQLTYQERQKALGYPNLHPNKKWVKGQSGNPAGRPKKPSLRSLIKEVATTRKKELVKKILELAIQGDIRAAEWIARYGEDPATLELNTNTFTLQLSPPREEEPYIEGEARLLEAPAEEAQ